MVAELRAMAALPYTRRRCTSLLVKSRCLADQWCDTDFWFKWLYDLGQICLTRRWFWALDKIEAESMLFWGCRRSGDGESPVHERFLGCDFHDGDSVCAPSCISSVLVVPLIRSLLASLFRIVGRTLYYFPAAWTWCTVNSLSKPLLLKIWN